MTRAPYAADPELSRGREFALDPGGTRGPRSAFQRDRDRIVHSIAFRRLRHKTQVFVAPDGDHYRVRLTHSLEVAQIARVIARALGLDEDLTEALALAHDLGHPPFGHAGEEALGGALHGEALPAGGDLLPVQATSARSWVAATREGKVSSVTWEEDPGPSGGRLVEAWQRTFDERLAEVRFAGRTLSLKLS